MNVTSQFGLVIQHLAAITIQPVAVMAAVLTVVLLILAGQALLRHSDPASAFAAAMGGFVLLSTSIGVWGLDLRLGALAVLPVAAWTLSRRDRFSGWGRPFFLVLAAILPLLLLLSDRKGSEWDEFSHWLHAFRYLNAYHVLPGGPDVPAIHSCCAAYPYAWPMVGMAAMMMSGFSEAVPALLNILLLTLFAALLLDLALAGRRRATFPMAAAAVLAATVASPTFVHKLAFSAYADVSTAFLAAMLALMGERYAAADGDLPRWRWATAFGLAAAALVAVKPGNTGLLCCILGGVLVLSLRQSGWRRVPRLELLPMIGLPLLCAGLWRWHVGRFLAGQEMAVMAPALWHVAEIPGILRGMLDVALSKGGHFGLGVAMIGLGGVGLVRNRGRADRLCTLAGLAFLGYNLFLLTTYVTVFTTYEALHVASFWRYNTHLGLVLMLPAAMIVGNLLERLSETRLAKGLGVLSVILALAGPVAMVTQIRFDAEPMKAFLRRVLPEAVAAMPPGIAAVVVDSSGSGLSGVMARYEWAGRARLQSYHSAFNSEPPLAWLNGQGVEWAFVVSGQSRLGLTPDTAALLIRRDTEGWAVVEQFPYPGGAVPARWP